MDFYEMQEARHHREGKGELPPIEAEPKTINLTPKWADLLPLLVEVAANGATAKGRAEAMAELRRLAQAVDELNAKDEPKAHPAYWFEDLNKINRAEFNAVTYRACAQRGEDIEEVNADAAEFWSVYLHEREGGSLCVADMPTADEASAYAKFMTSWLNA